MKTFVLLVALTVTLLGIVGAEVDKPESKTTPPDLAQFKSADELWAHIAELKRGPAERPTSAEEAQKIYGAYFSQLSMAIGEFVKQYPDDSRTWEAKMLNIAVIDAQAELDGKEVDPSRRDALLKEILAAKDAPPKIKADAALRLIQSHAGALTDDSKAEAFAAVEAEIVAFQKSNPDDPRNGGLQLARVEMLEKADPGKVEDLLKEIAKSDNPQIAAEAKQRLYLRELKSKPVELQFTAVDGSEVDLKKLRGKVVLVDFWATWCGPCRMSLPHVLETYSKLHDKGFEIVGISLDKDKEKLLAYTKEKGMTWAQYFDGKVWENEISRKFGITGIPAMWLLDKKGMLRETEARGNLEERVAKLLAE